VSESSQGPGGENRTPLSDELPLLSRTSRAWAEIAAAELPLFLADHAVCEQQAALTALNLVAHYHEDDELVRRMTGLAAEEVAHLRRVVTLLHRRGLRPARRRPNPYVQALRVRVEPEREPRLKIDRLLVGALIEARSCERFTTLLDVLGDRDPQVADLLGDLGPAEKRHWEMFYALAAREADADWLAGHWQGWLEHERNVAERGGRLPTVHG
jgi:tRNA-(ms[2]io[6]A)-hydroxylase